MGYRKLVHFSPGRMLLLSLFGAIFVGTILLALPIARTQSIPFIDLFFTATSALCVTGHFTVPLESFSTVGHCIILALIQIGGIGLITLALFLMSLFVNFGLATQLMAGQLLEINQWKNIKKIIIFVISATISIELIGTLIMLPIFSTQFPFSHACFFSLFHAVSSFCNAGISLFPSALHGYANSYVILLLTTALMLLGGLGFIPLREIITYISTRKEKKRFSFSLHSKIILYGSTILILTTAGILLFLESHLFTSDEPFLALIKSIFYAVSFRSTGFIINTIGSFQLATLLLIMVITFIGSSPGSTGSGIKITAFILFLATIKAAVSGQFSVNIRGRRIPKDQIFKATAIISLSIFWIFGTLFWLLILEKDHSFISLVFETVTSFTNLGLSLGITPLLLPSSKALLIANMIAGRVGSLTLVLALRKLTLGKTTTEIMYPEEQVILS